MDSLRVIAEPRRREILALVWNEEMSAGEIASRFDVTFGAVSQHLAVLRQAQFVKVRSDGNKRWYQADKDRLGPFREMLEIMWKQTLDQLAATVESDQTRDQ